MGKETANDFFDARVTEIERDYERLEHRLGWRFLGVPKRVLLARVRVAFISLNPGGDFEPPEHPRASCEAGNWYTTESWGGHKVGCSPLQRQVRLMFRCIADRTGFDGDSDELITSSLVANFIPFRSPSYARLPRRSESLLFANKLWAKVLPLVQPSLMICLGRVTETALTKLLSDALAARLDTKLDMDTGWGKNCATVWRFSVDDRKLTLLRLPHLSRFAVFTSSKCAAPMQRVMDAACLDLS